MKPGTPGFYALKEDYCMRAAAYSGTKNVYEDMLTSAKSLLMHSNVEKIYFLIEDDEFPFELPPEIECMNVEGQQYFPKDGPSHNQPWAYMVLLRAAYTKLFPDLDRILTIDVDTIVNENISDLWDLNLDDYYLAAMKESEQDGQLLVYPYANDGVAMLNLKKLREDKKDDEIIDALNTYFYWAREQDCFSELCYGKILFIDSDYNVCPYMATKPAHEKVTHFAGMKDWSKFPHFNYYKQLPISEIQRNVPDKFDLDIIIPTYKNKAALRRTLDSFVPPDDVHVIVIDDGSNMDYEEERQAYPWAHFYALEENHGPGVVRQCGLTLGTGMYVLFLDAGDYFYENGLETVLETIKKNTYIKLYSFSYVFDKSNKLVDVLDLKTIGKVYKRSFLEMYGIHYSEVGSYANEDYGFIMASQLVLKSFSQFGFPSQIKHILMPAFYQHVENHSLTTSKEHNYNYAMRPKGIIDNGINAIEIAKQNNVPVRLLMSACNDIMVREYTFLLDAAINQPESLESIWLVIRNFYLDYYRRYKKLQKDTSKLTQNVIKRLVRQNIFARGVRVNFSRFIRELETEASIPSYYYNYKDSAFIKLRSDNNAPVSRETTQRLQESNSEEEH